VTTAPEPEPEIPWMQPTTELPAQPTSRRRLIVLLLPVVGLLVLCCGGAALTTSFFRGDTPKTGQPTLVIPSSSPAPQPPPPTASPSPSPSARPTSRAPKTHPTTRKPRPTTARPTTTKPKPSPSATSGMIQQNVRVGQFCAPRGAVGVTRRGQVLRCGPSVDDPRNRWRPL
jgi:cytoskeletal protein RodZ